MTLCINRYIVPKEKALASIDLQELLKVPLTGKILNLKNALRLIIEYLQTTEDIIKLITSI